MEFYEFASPNTKYFYSTLSSTGHDIWNNLLTRLPCRAPLYSQLSFDEGIPRRWRAWWKCERKINRHKIFPNWKTLVYIFVLLNFFAALASSGRVVLFAKVIHSKCKYYCLKNTLERFTKTTPSSNLHTVISCLSTQTRIFEKKTFCTKKT